MTFDDLILESAQSITKATSSLMKAATAAQKELVSKGNMAETRQLLIIFEMANNDDHF